LFTNELKKFDKIRLRNGWDATIEDNLKGNTRLCTVYGFCTEMGSVYSHDIMYLWKGGNALTMEVAEATCSLEEMVHTQAQLRLKQRCAAMGF